MTVTGSSSSATSADVRNRGRQLLAASVGNLVEWFDWYAYSILAIYFAGQYFPASDASSMVPLLAALAVFAVGFFMRPLGGLLMGAVADRYGRKAALTSTIGLMGAGSLIIAVSPTYGQAGVLAPMLLVLARLMQGLSTGGEFAAASAFLAESAPPGRRGLFSSFVYVSAMGGNIAAVGSTAILANALSEANMRAWGWRVPFLLGAVAALVGLWIRRHADETHSQAGEIKAGRARRPGMFEFFQRHPRQALQVVGITVAPALIFYVWVVFLPTYAQVAVGYDKAKALTVGLISLVFFALIQPIYGMVSDRIGRKPMLIAFALGFSVCTVPLLGAIGTSFASLLLVQCAGMALLAGYSSIAGTVMSELFPTRLRVAGIGFPYSLAVAVFGGTGPYIATWLQGAGHANWFGWYVVACSLVSLGTYLTLRETHRAPLPE